jgi:hypothetical protein
MRPPKINPKSTTLTVLCPVLIPNDSTLHAMLWAKMLQLFFVCSCLFVYNQNQPNPEILFRVCIKRNVTVAVENETPIAIELRKTA